MATTSETIQQIRSLRAEIRNPRLPSAIAKTVEAVKTILATTSDQGQWKKVDWRSARPASSSSSSGYGSGSSSGSGSGSGQRGSSSGQRSGYGSGQSGQSGQSGHSQNGSNHRGSGQWGSGGGSSGNGSSSGQRNAFNHRNKPSYAQNEALPSIPLTYAPPTEDNGFEVVRRNRRQESSAPADFRTPPQKYVSKFKRTTDKVEDTILNTILLGKLNKFSPSNYDDIKEFITQIIASGQTEMMTCFMKLVFEKAASEEIFCPLYAKLLSELSELYPILLQEMSNLYAQYMSIFVDVTEEQEKTHQEFCQRNVEKKYRRGYSQFLAELTKHNVIETEVFVQTVLKIVEQIEIHQNDSTAVKRVEELADCLVRMMKAIHSEMVRKGGPVVVEEKEAEEKEEKARVTNVIRIRSMMKEEVAMRIQPFTVRRPDATGMSNKARFTFMDIYEGIQKYSR